MLLPLLLNSTDPLLEMTYIDELLKLNSLTKTSGLVLSREDAKAVIQGRNVVLKYNGRIELGFEVTKELIKNFHDSGFVTEDNYIPLLNELHEVFYYFKNETEEKLSDQDLIQIMKNYFTNSCGGSIELLKGVLEVFAADFRRKAQMMDFIESREE